MLTAVGRDADLSAGTDKGRKSSMRADRTEIEEHSESMKWEESCMRLKYWILKGFGGDALRGDTRSHPEHDG